MITTLARFFFNFGERHPEKPNCTSIDYGMTNVMMPLTLVGAMTGAYVYVSFPSVILQILLTLLLIMLTMQSAKKGMQIYRKENTQIAAEIKKMKESNHQNDNQGSFKNVNDSKVDSMTLLTPQTKSAPTPIMGTVPPAKRKEMLKET
jgi:uncharacterized membrane protein